jgi:hypothetical protein
MYRQAAQRLALIYGGILAATVVISVLLGAAAGTGLQRSVALGLYVSGSLFLIGCFVFGARGPLRGVSDDGQTVPLFGARRVRRADTDERSEATRTALLLFALGLSLVVIAAVVDPAHKAF